MGQITVGAASAARGGMLRGRPALRLGLPPRGSPGHPPCARRGGARACAPSPASLAAGAVHPRSPASTPAVARRAAPARRVVSGRRSPLAVDDVEGEQELLVRPITAKCDRPPARMARSLASASPRHPVSPSSRSASTCSPCRCRRADRGQEVRILLVATRWHPRRSAACSRTPLSVSVIRRRESLSQLSTRLLLLGGYHIEIPLNGRLRADPQLRACGLRPPSDPRVSTRDRRRTPAVLTWAPTRTSPADLYPGSCDWWPADGR